MALLGRLRASWAHTPLASRMVLLIIIIITTSLTVVGAVMIGILQRHLINQVDTQLRTTAAQMATEITGASLGSDPSVPTNYYIRSNVEGEDPKQIITPETRNRAGVPQIDELLASNALLQNPTGITQPLTVRSSLPGATWRAVVVSMVNRNTGEPMGSVVVALPLVDVTETIINTTISFLLASLSILALSSLAGHYLVRQSLRPLRSIEVTAGKIAGGDLSQRIPLASPATEVGSLALSLNAMLAQIEASFNARDESEQKMRRFISDASHELRTPLAAIRGYGELYRLGGVPEERIDDVMGRIESESTRMGVLVEDLLILARMDEKRSLAVTDVDLVRLAQAAKSDLQALDPTRPVRLQGLTSRKPPTSLLIKADQDQLTQVLVNLMGNIDRYTPRGSPMEMLVGQEEDQAVIVLRDHGPGIDAAEQEQVFERFYRTDRSRSRELGGSGLGLSIVGGIVEAHAGTVRLSDTSGGGLTVTVRLPLQGPSSD